MRDRDAIPLNGIGASGQLVWFFPAWSICAALLLIAVVFGGGTYQRSWPDAVVQLASLPVLGLASWLIAPRWSETRIRTALLVAGAFLAWPLLQLLPLPPSVWTMLPGREMIEAGFRGAKIELPWFPISLSPAETWRSALSLLPPLAIFLSALSLGRRARRALTICLISVGFLSVVLGLAQIAGGREGPFRLYGEGAAAVGFFINRNHYAALLYAIIPFTAAWAVGLAADRRPETFIGIILCLLVFVSLLLGLGMAQSRAGFTLAFLAAAGSLALAWHAGALSAARGRWFILAATLVAIVLVVQFASVGIMQRLESDPLADDRWTFTAVTLRAALDFLPFGSGFGTFDSIFKMYESVDMLAPSYVNNAHNDFAEAFLEGGLGSAALLAAFLGWFFIIAAEIWRTPRRSRVSALDISLARAGSLTIALLLLHSAFDYPLRSAALASILAFSCALMLPPFSSPSDNRSGRERDRYPRGPATATTPE